MKRKRGKLKLLLLIALGLATLVFLLLGAGLGRQRWLAGRAMASREIVESTYPTQDSYTPPLELPISAQRLQVFLAVRAELAGYCPMVTELRDSFSAVDAHVAAVEGSERPPTREDVAEGAGRIGATFRSIYRAATRINAYGVDRNEALLEHGMGLGEFTFLNLVACFSAPGRGPGGFLGPKEGAPIYSGRVAAQLREMIARHVTLLEQRVAAGAENERPLLRERLAVWRREHEALAADPDRNLFADGLPAELSIVLRPQTERLVRLCCPAASELDLARVVPAGGVWYDHR